MSRVSLVACVVLAFGLVGCGESQLPTVEVKANVTVDGKPYGPALLSLSAATKGKDPMPNASGPVSADGSAKLASYPNKPGVVVGSYVANLLPDPMNPANAPIVKGIPVEVKSAGQSIDFAFTAEKNAKPGTLPDTSGLAGATSILTPP